MVVYVVALVALIVAALYVLHLLAVWAESRGWIYYRTNRPPPGASARAANVVASFVQPETEHVVDAENVVEEDHHDGP